MTRLAHARIAQGLLVLGGLACLGCDPETEAGDPVEPVPAVEHPEGPGPAPPVAEPSQVPTSPAPPEPARRKPWPPTTLSLGLLATLEASDGAQSRATIRDDDSGVIASYRPGDRIREDVELLSIEDGVVELSNAGEVEYLSVSEIPIELSADDVFYPDLVDDLHRSGSMDDAVPLPPGPEYTVKAESYAWGTPRTIAQLRDVIRSYARDRDVPKVHVGDISRRHGGPFPPHLSHQDGRDVDVAYVLLDRRTRFGAANRLSLDRENSWALLRSFIDSGAVLYLFVDYELQHLLYEEARAMGATEVQLERWFQYPYGRRAARGIIRHWKGHDDHFHVRFAP
ncbi:MAG: penicillin-insensitive murein endopeptidase [Myxococcales bacterium]|nr:penicillin-insensitive murein endopeptidase [Myxococcales bacterium]MCB9716609.1 penicillin-insensitive murein endopeptidase [Myxococcales bacterium]